MIIDSIDNCKFYYGLNSGFKKAFEYLQTVDLKNIQCGKYEIDGDSIFVSIMEYKTKNINDCLWEAHKKYIDIQYIISGKEKMGYVNKDKINITNEYNADTDIMFGNAEGQFNCISEGEFIIFTPNDGHMPSLMVENSKLVKKAVVKILL